MRDFKTLTEAAIVAKPGEYLMLHSSGSSDDKIWAVMSQEERDALPVGNPHDEFITWARVEGSMLSTELRGSELCNNNI